jgi:hypothetical protein
MFSAILISMVLGGPCTPEACAPACATETTREYAIRPVRQIVATVVKVHEARHDARKARAEKRKANACAPAACAPATCAPAIPAACAPAIPACEKVAKVAREHKIVKVVRKVAQRRHKEVGACAPAACAPAACAPAAAPTCPAPVPGK